MTASTLPADLAIAPAGGHTAPASLSYEQSGVNYALIDPLKVSAQRAAAATAAQLTGHGFSEVAASRGESAYVVDVGPFYLASIVECLGSKTLVADEMARLTGRSWYAGIAQDTIAMAVNDLITVGATPLVVQATGPPAAPTGFWTLPGPKPWWPAGSRLARSARWPGAAAKPLHWPASWPMAASTWRPPAPA